MMWTTSGVKRAVATAFVLAALGGSCAHAQPLYKYRDANGGWVFSDRRPLGVAAVEQLSIPRGESPGVVRIYQRTDATGAPVLAAENSFYGVVQVAFRVVSSTNLSPLVPLSGNRILPVRSDTALFELEPVDREAPIRVAVEYQYIHGDPGAHHRPASAYRLPYARASSHPVTQAFPDVLTHTDRANEHAIDFAMPIGTSVLAARDGLVLEIANDFYEAGMDASYESQANMVRMLHADGTMAIYAHLNWNSIRVQPGQLVAAGEQIADSGNTGFSSGPHLHFVVQRNIGGEIASVPLEFVGPGNAAITLQTGDRPVAY